MQTSYLKVDILSPVHIGSGTTVDAFDYVVEAADAGGYCHFVDVGAWAAEYADQEELLGVFNSGSIGSMRAFMAEHLDPQSYSERTCRIENAEIVSTYQRKQIDPNNRLELSPNLIGGSGGALLPGSSIKGAIRTAVIDWLDREKGLRLKNGRNVNDHNRTLKDYLGEITNNSFQELKISDCETALDSSLIVAAKEVRRNPEKDVTPKANSEVLASRLLGDAQESTLACKLVLGSARGGRSHDVLQLKKGGSFTWEQLAELVNSYSKMRYAKEKGTFWSLPHFSEAANAMVTIESLILQPPAGSMVLKVGHYSQIEYVTVTDNKPLTRKAKGGGNLPHGTTRTLADGIYPFGWIMLTPCSEEEYRTIQKGLSDRAEARRAAREQNRAKHLAAYQQKNAERMQKLAAEKAAAAERERIRQEEAAKPWLVWIRQLQQIADWGALKQFMERPEVVEHQGNRELAQVVLDAAIGVRDKKPEKWTVERAGLVNQWLAVAGLSLPTETGQAEMSEVLPEDVAEIEDLKEFGDYQNADLDLASLSRHALAALSRKMQSWDCHKKKAKPNKKEAYNQVQQMLRSN